MRMLVALTAAAVIAATAVPASATSLTSFDVSPASPVSLATTEALDVTGAASFEAPARAQVFSDGPIDDQLLLEATPGFVDLKAGFVAVDRQNNTLDLTWQVYDLPDAGGTPEVARYIWDFSLAAPGSDEATDFQAQAKFTNLVDRANLGAGSVQTAIPAGKLSGNCTTDQTTNVISCVKTAEPAVTYDGVADEITVHIPFADLKDGAGNPLAIEGAHLRPTTIFLGVAAILQAVVSSGNMGDVADQGVPDVTIGNHVEMGLNLLDTPAELMDLSTHAPAGPAGDFAGSLPLEGSGPGSYVVAARPCVDAACAPVETRPVTLTA